MVHRALSILLVALGLGIAAGSMLIAPLTLVTAVLAARDHPVAPLLALGIGVYPLYTYAQVIIDQEAAWERRALRPGPP